MNFTLGNQQCTQQISPTKATKKPECGARKEIKSYCIPKILNNVIIIAEVMK